jgi:demethylmenaquinone methyltransferase/2-methoxy-6-polyprenyl-1,4-benzoquinol methylase
MNKGIQKIFSEIPDKYEIVNHILTFGLDIYWRRKSARLASEEGVLFLDVCTGTGEMALNLVRKGKRVVALDFCFPMLEIARRKDSEINFIIGDA